MSSHSDSIPATHRRVGRRRPLVLGTVAALTLGGGAIGVVTATSASAATVDTNAWYVLVNQSSGKALDVYNLSTADGGQIVQYARNNGNWQQWKFVSVGSGYYRVESRHSGKVLDVYEHSTANNAPIAQWASLGNPNQQFRLADSSGGRVRLISRLSNKALQPSGGSTADAARIVQYTDSDAGAQQWNLVKVGTGGGATTPPPTGGGSGNGAWPSAAGRVKVSSTTAVSGTFDGGLKEYYGIGDGGQSESQDPMFEIANGGTLQNVLIGAPAGDGVHCLGSCTIRNVWWLDVGEDAATFKGTSSSMTALVDGGGARSASDKVFQHNGAGTVTIRNFQVESAGKLYRSCGNCSTSYKRNVVMSGITARSTKVLAGINTNFGDTARFSGITVYGTTSICDKYKGVPKGSEPTKIGSGADGVNCIYSSSDITQR